jgi:hypothetical protein
MTHRLGTTLTVLIALALATASTDAYGQTREAPGFEERPDASRMDEIRDVKRRVRELRAEYEAQGTLTPEASAQLAEVEARADAMEKEEKERGVSRERVGPWEGLGLLVLSVALAAIASRQRSVHKGP